MRIYEARGDEVELLLSDVVLPGESGRVLAGRLRREDPWLKILLVTGYADQMGPAARCRRNVWPSHFLLRCCWEV